MCHGTISPGQDKGKVRRYVWARIFGSGRCQQWNMGGSRVDVYLVSGLCDVRSSDP